MLTDQLGVSVQTLAAAATLCGTLVTVAVVYLKLFVENKLSELRAAIIDTVQRNSAEAFLGKHVEKELAIRFADVDKRLNRLEESS